MCKYTPFQSSAARSQGPDRKWCSPGIETPAKPASGAEFGRIVYVCRSDLIHAAANFDCENPANSVPDKRFVRKEAAEPGRCPNTTPILNVRTTVHVYSFTSHDVPVTLYLGANSLPVQSVSTSKNVTATVKYSKYNEAITIEP
jgi:hypothetical protein